ncbi:MAG: citrate synthase [Conexivisphaerales archaeon]
MKEHMEQISKGLEDINLKWTKLTSIDGEKGILKYGGYKIEDIIKGKALVEEVQYLFLHGELPNKRQLADFQGKIHDGYSVPKYVIDAITNLPYESDAVALQMNAFAALAATEKFKWDKQADRDVAAKVIGNMATITAAAYRHISGMKPLEPEPSSSYAESFLKAAFGKKPSQQEIDAINTALILYMDHEVPASTTAGLVVVSTLADMYSGIVGALAALKGPLHGGAAEAAISQFAQIGDPAKAEEWFNQNIVTGKSRLMGFGHRVYKTYDPRAKIFKSMAVDLIKNNREAEKMYKIALKVEELGIKNMASKGIYPNTDFFSGITYMSLGFPLKNNIYTAIFALSRVTGWMGHFIEYVEEQHRLIRPRAVYTGPEDRSFIPISRR